LTVSSSARLLIKLALGAMALGIIAVGIAAALLIPPYVKSRVISEARLRGVELVPGDVAFGFGWVRVDDAKFRLIGVQGIGGSAYTIELDLDWLDPLGAKARRVEIEIVGPTAQVMKELEAWNTRYKDALKLPAKVTELNLKWREKAAAKEWLAVTNASADWRRPVLAARVDSVVVENIDLGKVGLDYNAQDAVVAVGLGAADLKSAPLRIHLRHAAAQPTASITLAPVEVAPLLKRLNAPLSIEGVKASAAINLLINGKLLDAPIRGRAAIRLEGWIPPHPPEIDGFVFGKVTTIDSAFDVAADHKLVTLSETKLAAGSFKLAGGGTMTRNPDYSEIKLVLSGALPCAALINSAAQSRLGKAIGRWVGAGAQFWLNGSVNVTVRVLADTRKLAEALVVPAIGIGCGLRPLPITIPGMPKLPDLPKFDLPFPPMGGSGSGEKKNELSAESTSAPP
jgi:ADP-dependent NAD(P)H-hydrate dehydratase / NAD(P)H-hydrate epimerase